MPKTKGVLLVNLGTPDSAKTADVRKYLREFLSDGRVIDINAAGRFALVNFIIAPFRSPKSAAEYRKLWTDRGSPLLYYTEALAEKVQETLGETYDVQFGMRYQNPSLESVLAKFKENKALEELLVVPLFPQYAGATTGSVHQKVMELVKDWPLIPKMTFIDQYCDWDEMLSIYAENGRKYLQAEKYDKVLFSFHGLPVRQLTKADSTCQGTDSCCIPYGGRNRLCYRAQCVQTARQLADKLQLSSSDYIITFQSRLGRAEWIQPYTDKTIERLAESGAKKLLVFSPAFVSDCLETTIEIGEAYAEDFVDMGGEKLQLVESLNDDPRWIKALSSLITNSIGD